MKDDITQAIRTTQKRVEENQLAILEGRPLPGDVPIMHLRVEGQSYEEGAKLRTRCGQTVYREQTAWDALDVVTRSTPHEVCRECLDAEVSELIRQIHSLTIRLVGYREHFYGYKG